MREHKYVAQDFQLYYLVWKLGIIRIFEFLNLLIFSEDFIWCIKLGHSRLNSILETVFV